ncbi:MAG: PQQ-like beta-propeller repeat protein, partial [Holophagales bacterium]|nr:PQQ-like beta-propeller repeat protein [Holophagales bacterium]
IVSGTERVRSYDLATGKELWQCGGLSANVVATPVSADGRVYVASSYDIRAMLAIALDGAEGDITGSENVLWSRTERTPYVPSPLLYDGALYFLRHYQGVLTRVEAETGREPTGPLRLPGIRNIYASPVGAAGRIYVTDRQGSTIVLSHAEKPEVLAINQLPDRFSASPVPVGDALLLRGERRLWCLAESSGQVPSP